ncbi:MAG: hypothetical protein IJB79_02375 [Candidatus Gastranaerophilales bacterium]|nr:hypothetical protein [Candidatus Gastranaerophilales bacterium]
MKKLLILCLLFSCAFAYEDVPLLIDTSSVNIETKQDDKELIEIQNMKKMESVKKAKDEKIDSQIPKIKLDTRQIHHQRTLDYMNNRGSGTMLPIF